LGTSSRDRIACGEVGDFAIDQTSLIPGQNGKTSFIREFVFLSEQAVVEFSGIGGGVIFGALSMPEMAKWQQSKQFKPHRSEGLGDRANTDNLVSCPSGLR
jgi:hypothetical protein